MYIVVVVSLKVMYCMVCTHTVYLRVFSSDYEDDRRCIKSYIALCMTVQLPFMENNVERHTQRLNVVNRTK